MATIQQRSQLAQEIAELQRQSRVKRLWWIVAGVAGALLLVGLVIAVGWRGSLAILTPIAGLAVFVAFILVCVHVLSKIWRAISNVADRK
jgi:hypothetical protein